MVQRERERENPKVTYLLVEEELCGGKEDGESKYIDQGNIDVLKYSTTSVIEALAAAVLKLVVMHVCNGDGGGGGLVVITSSLRS